MSRSQFYAFIFILFPVLFFLYKPIHVGDLSIWVALGRDSLLQHKLLRHDPYTLTQTSEMVYPAVLSLLYGGLFLVGGLSFVAAIHALIPALWVVLWLRFLREDDTSIFALPIWNWKVFLTFTVSLVGTSLIFAARPATVATILLLLSYIVLTQNPGRLGLKTVLQLCALEIAWVNCHGSFLILPLMMIWQGLAKADFRRLALAFGVALCALVNPFGWRVFPYILETARLSQSRGLEEWFAPHYFYYPFASGYFYAGSLVLVAYLVWRQPNRWWSDPFIPIWLAGFFALRNTFMPFLLFPIFAANELREKAPASQSSKFINLAIVSFLVLAIAFMPLRLDSRAHVENINRYLREHTGSIFNESVYGSDLALQQPNKYFIDIRNVIFSDEVDHQYDLFLAKPDEGFPAIEAYHFRYFLMGDRHPTLFNWLKTRFKIVATDGPATLFESH